jgi:hypothetical protein
MATALTSTRDWVMITRELGTDFATRAAMHDASVTFVAENYTALKPDFDTS